MEKEIDKVNLGCGKLILDGYKNYDYKPVNRSVEYLNLEQLPLPFHDNSIKKEILLHHVLEHINLSVRYDLLLDLHRVMQGTCTLSVILPLFDTRLTHKSFFHPRGYLNDVLFDGSTTIENQKLFNKKFRYEFKRFTFDFPFFYFCCHWWLKKNLKEM